MIDGEHHAAGTLEVSLLDPSYKRHPVGAMFSVGPASSLPSNLGDGFLLVGAGAAATDFGCPAGASCLMAPDGKMVTTLVPEVDGVEVATSDPWVDLSDDGLFYGSSDTWYAHDQEVLRTLPPDLGFRTDGVFEGIVFGSTTDQYIAHDLTDGATAVMTEPDRPIALVNGWILWESGLLQPPGEDVRDVLPAFS